MTAAADAELIAVLREAKGRIRHKSSCPPPASNFQNRQPCKCGRDTLIDRIEAILRGLKAYG